MKHPNPTCALLADRHTALADGIRGLLETCFESVYLVADVRSLSNGAKRLKPHLIILDLSLVGGDLPGLLKDIAGQSPDSRVIVITVHDESNVPALALDAGARGVVLKRCVGRDFLDAVDTVLRGDRYVSPDFGVA
jgi:two-component system invasion response regulator UvrY